MVGGTPTSSFKVAPNHPVRVVLADPSGVLIGGEFSSITSVARQNLVAINASTGAADMSAIPSADGAVRAFARSADGSTLYVAGTFTHIGSVARNHLAAIDVASGSVTSFNPNVDGEVAALTVRGNSLYLGGTFSHVGGLNALNAARISLGSSLVDATWTPSPDRGINAIALSPDGDTVYLGGAFVNVGADSRPYLAAVKTQGGALTDWRPSTPKLVFAVTVQSDGSIFAGTGGKSEAGNNVIKYRPNGDTPEIFRVHGDGDVQALRLSPDENTLYVGGHMHNLITPYAAPRAQTYSMASSDGSITSWAPDLDIRFKGVWALDVTGSSVILAGQFTRIGPTVAEGLAILPGTP
jgi:WD40 repeat protein